MKKRTFLIIILLFEALCYNVFAQTISYPFEVKKSGQGTKSIIFIPGFGCSGDVWNETKAQFEKNHTCYTLTMAGFAGIKPQAGASFENWEKSIAAFIQKNNLVKPVVIGHSMGGGLAMALAADYPNLVEKIIVVDALPCLAAIMNPAFQSKEKNDCSNIVNQIVNATDEQFYQMQKNSIPQLVANTAKQDTIIKWSLASDRKTFAEMFCDFSNTDLRTKIKNITCPSLILLEANFKHIQEAVDEQYKKLNKAQLKYADKGLHFIMYDDTEWYMNQLTNFITSTL